MCHQLLPASTFPESNAAAPPGSAAWLASFASAGSSVTVCQMIEVLFHRTVCPALIVVAAGSKLCKCITTVAAGSGPL